MKRKWKIKVRRYNFPDDMWNIEIISPNGVLVFFSHNVKHKCLALRTVKSFINSTGADVNVEVVE